MIITTILYNPPRLPDLDHLDIYPLLLSENYCFLIFLDTGLIIYKSSLFHYTTPFIVIVVKVNSMAADVYYCLLHKNDVILPPFYFYSKVEPKIITWPGGNTRCYFWHTFHYVLAYIIWKILHRKKNSFIGISSSKRHFRLNKTLC